MDIKYWCPHGSNDFYAINSDSLSSDPKPEPLVSDKPLAKNERKAQNPARIEISITSYRKRLLDPDNLCPKYFIDALRYAQIIPDDREKDIIHTVSQKKVAKKSQEKTLITITYP